MRNAFLQAVVRLGNGHPLVAQRFTELIYSPYRFGYLPCATCGAWVSRAAYLNSEFQPVCRECAR